MASKKVSNLKKFLAECETHYEGRVHLMANLYKNLDVVREEMPESQPALVRLIDLMRGDIEHEGELWKAAREKFIAKAAKAGK